METGGCQLQTRRKYGREGERVKPESVAASGKSKPLLKIQKGSKKMFMVEIVSFYWILFLVTWYLGNTKCKYGVFLHLSCFLFLVETREY